MTDSVTMHCDRCNRIYTTITVLNPHCLPCAIASDAIDHRQIWTRPLTTAELTKAHRTACRRRHLQVVA